MPEKAALTQPHLVKAFFDSASEGLLAANDQGIILLANPAVERIFGYSPAELLGQNISLLMPLPYNVEHSAYVRAHILSGSHDRCTCGGPKNALHKDGSLVPVDISIGDLHTDAGHVFTAVIRRSDKTPEPGGEGSRLSRSQGVVDTSYDGIVTVDPYGTIVGTTPAVERIFGYSAEEMNGESITLFMPATVRHDHLGYFVNGFSELDLEACAQGREVKGVRRSGEEFPLYRSFTISSTPKGKVITMIVRDLSDRRAVEESLWRANTKLNHLLHHSPAVLYAFSADRLSGAPYMITGNVKDMLGYSVEESLDPTWWTENVHPEDLPRAITSLREAVENGHATRYYRIRHKSGEYRSLEDRKRLTVGPDGKPQEVVGIWWDITERKEIEEALFESEARFRELLENVELIAIIVDRNETVKFCNDFLLRLSGRTSEEVIGQNFFDLFVADEDQSERRRCFAVFKQGIPRHHHESAIITKDGGRREIRWNSIILRDQEGKPWGVASIGEDITDRNRALLALQKAYEATESIVRERTNDLARSNEALLQAKDQADAANRAKSEFLSRMSHELRTPLNSVLGYSQLMLLQYRDPKILDGATAIRKAGQHLLNLINEILDISRIESGDLAIFKEPVAVLDAITQSIGLVQPIAVEHGIEISFDASRADHYWIEADRQRFVQILVNLLSNAIKYNRPEGRVTIDVQRVENLVWIDVSDTGIGISAKDQESLFRPFQRFGDTTVEGTGLGLALSERFCRMIGGSLRLVNSSPTGSTFRAEFRIHDEETQKELEAQGCDALPEKRRGSIVSIEDNAANMRLLEEVLLDWPEVKILPAIQGTVGLELVRRHRPDLVLLDLHLPDISGEVILRTLRLDETTKHIPVIVLSADATPRKIDALLKMGADEYMTKPIDLKAFYDLVARYLPRAEPD